MGRGGKVGNKQYGNRRRIQSKDRGSDESDEDYTVGADEEFEDSDEYGSSLAGEELQESSGVFEEEEEEDKDEDEDKNLRKVGRSKAQKGFPVRKKSCLAREESEESLGEFEEDDEDEEKLRKVRWSKGRKCFLGGKKNEVGKAHKKRRVSYKKENEEDYEDEDYDDDDEEEEEDDEDFTPDETDLDYEDDLTPRKKNKVGRLPLWEKGFVKGRKRKRNSKITKKRIQKKPTKSRRLQRKSAAGNDGAFAKNPVVKESGEKNFGPRKRRFMADSDSDSDFVCSALANFEYTISEEEREQMREASEFCRDLTTNLRNVSSEKRLQDEGALSQERKCLGRKGKEKVEDLKNEAGKQVCGICLSEEGKKTVRGTLDCCSHYFCFACIMEWSKVESRCPVCKQRFVTISKPSKSSTGFDLRTMVVQVPERDQVYQPSEEELRGYLDPYENVICTECQQGGDDAFMLLCDLCDSPAHTYCVGLGCEVPEGNWYCEGCRPTALGSSNPQAPNPTPDQRTINDLSGRSFPIENVREVIDLNTMYVPETPLTPGTGIFSSTRHAGGDFHAASPVSGAGVSTVSERRRIQRQIHHLLNNRMIQLVGRTNGMLGNNLLGSQIERVREIAFQHATTPEALASHHTFSQGRLQDNFTPSVQSRDLFPARSSHSRDQQSWGLTSTSADGSVNGMLQAGLSGISVGVNSRLGYEHLHPCTSRSSISDATMSPYRYREATVRSRTLQETVHRPF